MAEQQYRHIVRLFDRDLDGRKKVVAALADLKGVGQNLAHAILGALKIDPKMRLGMLSDDQLARIDAALKDPSKAGIPAWFFNRRKDPESGANLHLIGANLELSVRSDIDREKALASWRGIRHALGLKVRGQRTRTTGRKGMTIGVKKARS